MTKASAIYSIRAAVWALVIGFLAVGTAPIWARPANVAAITESGVIIFATSVPERQAFAPLAAALPTQAPTSAPTAQPELALAQPTAPVPTPELAGSAEPAHVDAPIAQAPAVLPPDAPAAVAPVESRTFYPDGSYTLPGSALRYYPDSSGAVVDVRLSGSEPSVASAEGAPAEQQVFLQPEHWAEVPTAAPQSAPCPGRARAGRCG